MECDEPTKKVTKEIDDLDMQIVTLLQTNSRLSFRQIAKRLGIPTATAFNRAKRLEANGTLRRYTISIDALKLGLDCTALVQIQTQGNHLEELEQEIAQNANVVAAYSTAGEYDVAAIVKFKDVPQLHEFGGRLENLPYVKRKVIMMALNVIKEDYQISLPPNGPGTHLWGKRGVNSCRDCANFEDRREIEKVALCAMNHGPGVCCPEFEPRSRKTSASKLQNRFCLKCANFENVDGIAICARDHRPGVACAAFRDRSDALTVIA